ncbi:MULTISPECIES: AlbA family DNA-binding domain-containing protein [Mesorhizobium]|uniref:ATP-binding protein n=1 Tax=Mesorhizobium denitrificans TaxID=2294114 RepID=A0A371X8U3_9HYPH|nr:MULTISPECIES: ATP-binding protein [Mesorhizobium]RFC65657.1 ATP-binding protein [Mesorhizobium denitrificans]
MSKRSITDQEIGLIKAMLARGMKNKDIQFFFNRPDRAVNSGRMSQVRDGSYGAEVPQATDAELDAFIAAPKPEGHVAAVGVPTVIASSPPDEGPKGPLHADVIAGQFAADSGGTWRLSSGETDQHECKGSFGFKHCHEWIRAIAALANNRGGYIFFGVHDKDGAATAESDKSYAVTGLTNDEFVKADPADFTKLIRSYLDPTPSVLTVAAVVGAKTIGVMHVAQHPGRPVIVRTGDGKVLKEGDIFFRYSGSCERIKYSDLRAILDARDAVARLGVLPLVERLLALGPARALIADLDKGVLDDGKRPIVIGPALLDQIKFIREGEFDEKAGAPTLKLVGDVTANGDAIRPTIVRGNITPDAVLRNCLTREKVAHPAAYLAHSAHSNREWQPIWFYLDHAGLSVGDAIKLLTKEPASQPTHRDAAIARLSGKKSAYKENAGKPKQIVKALAAGQVDEPGDDSEAHKFALAVQGLPDGAPKLAEILTVLLKCFEQATPQKRATATSAAQSFEQLAALMSCFGSRKSRRNNAPRTGLRHACRARNYR